MNSNMESNCKIAIITITKNSLLNGLDLLDEIGGDIYCLKDYRVHDSNNDNLSNDKANDSKFNDPRIQIINGGLGNFTKKLFEDYQVLIYVMATGIVVRSIAPYLKGKTQDPAIVVLDEKFKFAISLLSGHLGGANEWANKVAKLTGAVPVITTATDINNVIAFDIVAKNNNCVIENITDLKKISVGLLCGKVVYLYSPYEVVGEADNVKIVKLSGDNGKELDEVEDEKLTVYISNRDFRKIKTEDDKATTLILRPKNLFLGVGFKKGISVEFFRDCFYDFIKKSGVSPLSIRALATVDIKKEDKAFQEFAKELGLSIDFYTKDELVPYEGRFSYSDFVKEKVGAGSVSEPCAYLASKEGKLIVKKTLYQGVTFALCEEKTIIDLFG